MAPCRFSTTLARDPGPARNLTSVLSLYLSGAEQHRPKLFFLESPMGHGLIAWIIIGIIAGWITGKLMKGSGFGVIMDMIVGLIGALIGGFIMSHIFGAASSGGFIYSIIVAVIGAVLLTFLLRLITGNRSSNL